MIYDFLYEESWIVETVLTEYQTLRKRGLNREKSISEIFTEYQNELVDEDDKDYLFISVAIALCLQKELTEQIRSAALESVNKLKKNSINHIQQSKYEKLIRYISDEKTGPEAVYKSRKKYDPEWKTGDTFIHAFSQPTAMKMGLDGWYAVLRKVGEYMDQEGHYIQLVYITICSADSIPKTDEELQALGCLRMMEHDCGWDYLAQLYYKNKTDEDRWQLHKIGSFPNAGNPADATMEDPVVSMPFSGVIHRNSSMLAYEDRICQMLKSNGINKNEVIWKGF